MPNQANPMHPLDILRLLLACAICENEVTDPVIPVCGCDITCCRKCVHDEWKATEPEFDSMVQEKLIAINMSKKASCPKCSKNLINDIIVPKLAGKNTGTLPGMNKFRTEAIGDEQYMKWFDVCWIADGARRQFLGKRIKCTDRECEDEFSSFVNFPKWVYHIFHHNHVIEGQGDSLCQKFTDFFGVFMGKLYCFKKLSY